MSLDQLLSELEELEKKATPGPWEQYAIDYDADGIRSTTKLDERGRKEDIILASIRFEESGAKTKEDCKFIVQSRNALPKLIQAVKTLKGAVEFYAEMPTRVLDRNPSLDEMISRGMKPKEVVCNVIDRGNEARKALAEVEEMFK